jgi:hypothetical protein
MLLKGYGAPSGRQRGGTTSVSVASQKLAARFPTIIPQVRTPLPRFTTSIARPLPTKAPNVKVGAAPGATAPAEQTLTNYAPVYERGLDDLQMGTPRPTQSAMPAVDESVEDVPMLLGYQRKHVLLAGVAVAALGAYFYSKRKKAQ